MTKIKQNGWNKLNNINFQCYNYDQFINSINFDFLHKLKNQQSNRANQYNIVRKLFKLFIVQNRTPTGRKDGKQYKLLALWTRLRNNNRPTEVSTHALANAFQKWII